MSPDPGTPEWITAHQARLEANRAANPSSYDALLARIETLEASTELLERVEELEDRPIGCSLRVVNGGNPFAGAYTWTEVGLGTEYLDTNNSHAGSSGQWTIPLTGWWHVTAHGCFNNNANGWRGAMVNIVAGTVLVASNVRAVDGEVTAFSVSGIHYLTAGQVVQYRAQHNVAGIVSHYADGKLGSGMDLFYLGSVP